MARPKKSFTWDTQDIILFMVDKRFTQEDICKELQVSSEWVNYKCKELFGMSFSELSKSRKYYQKISAQRRCEQAAEIASKQGGNSFQRWYDGYLLDIPTWPQQNNQTEVNINLRGQEVEQLAANAIAKLNKFRELNPNSTGTVGAYPSHSQNSDRNIAGGSLLREANEVFNGSISTQSSTDHT